MRVTVRGDLYDGRSFIKSAMAGGGSSGSKQKHDNKDIDLDVKLGTVVGYHGETLRGLDLRLSRRGGVITSLALNAKLGRDTPLTGDVRGRGNTGRPVIFVETNDAGAFFRFNDIYPKIIGGEMWVALDPQSADQSPQDGILNIREFTVRGESALDRVAGSQPGSQGVEFSRMRVDFTRSVGKLTIKEGIVRGQVDGATVDGYIDYTRDDAHARHLRAALWPQQHVRSDPDRRALLGGSNEGLLVTYEVVGPPNGPILRVNRPRWRRACCASSSSSSGNAGAAEFRRSARSGTRPASAGRAASRRARLDHAFRRASGEHHLLVGYRRVVHLEAATLDLPPRVAVRRRAPHRRRLSTPGPHRASRVDLDGRQRLGDPVALELRRAVSAAAGGLAAMQQGRGLGGGTFFASLSS